MSFFKEELKTVRAFIFDVDGVLSRDVSPLDTHGDPVRTASVKDGFAIRSAIAAGFPVAVITGGYSDRVKLRYLKLGVSWYYDNVRNKVECVNDFLQKTGSSREQVLYMGDDLVDYQAMLTIGIPVCPRDAVSDIIRISKYVSDRNGGEGCVRDVIEQTLRAQDKWLTNEMFRQQAV